MKVAKKLVSVESTHEKWELMLSQTISTITLWSPDLVLQFLMGGLD